MPPTPATVHHHAENIKRAIELAHHAGVSVLIGGDPPVIQVTDLKTQSYVISISRVTWKTHGSTSQNGPIADESAAGRDSELGSLAGPPRSDAGAGSVNGVKKSPPSGHKDPPTVTAARTGDICVKCGSSDMVRAGACAVCLSCGESGGCG
jgi:hypothetical protein